ncbi:hypothetical protein EDB92DRAFT_2103254 [Lactarius akahatsu]|uniref:Uncharacterized protein n=1 Tax=Lactarius akahatsu TaxID=416441 RepID=A0AAD4Q8F4_9AGAM|nr:hypothetical protein EDB92DRAFT_2103254 [Lactarius akahatsu]
MWWSPSRSPSSLLGRGSPHRCRRRRHYPAIVVAIRYRIVLAVAGVAVTAAVAVLSVAAVVAVIVVSSVVGVRCCCVAVFSTAIVDLVVVGVAFRLASAERPGGGGRGRGRSSCVVVIEVVRSKRWSLDLMQSDSGGIQNPPTTTRRRAQTAPKKAPGVARRLQLREAVGEQLAQWGSHTTLFRFLRTVRLLNGPEPAGMRTCNPRKWNNKVLTGYSTNCHHHRIRLPRRPPRHCHHHYRLGESRVPATTRPQRGERYRRPQATIMRGDIDAEDDDGSQAMATRRRRLTAASDDIVKASWRCHPSCPGTQPTVVNITADTSTMTVTDHDERWRHDDDDDEAMTTATTAAETRWLRRDDDCSSDDRDNGDNEAIFCDPLGIFYQASYSEEVNETIHTEKPEKLELKTICLKTITSMIERSYIAVIRTVLSRVSHLALNRFVSPSCGRPEFDIALRDTKSLSLGVSHRAAPDQLYHNSNPQSLGTSTKHGL